jgi:hypothetical protein
VDVPLRVAALIFPKNVMPDLLASPVDQSSDITQISSRERTMNTIGHKAQIEYQTRSLIEFLLGDRGRQGWLESYQLSSAPEGCPARITIEDCLIAV